MNFLFKLVIIVLIFFHSLNLIAQASSPVFELKELPDRGVMLNNGWKYQAGDNIEWAKPGYNDQDWQHIDPTKDIKDLPQLWQTNIGWFRLHLAVDSLLRGQTLALLAEQNGASEIYLNGRLLKKIGQISSDPKEVQALTLPQGNLIALPLSNNPQQILAVRFALQKELPYLQFGDTRNWALQFHINEVGAAAKRVKSIDLAITPFEYLRAGCFLMLGILHLAFFWFYPAQRANLYFFVYAMLTALSSATGHLAYEVFLVETKVHLIITTLIIGLILNYIFYLRALYELFKLPKGIIFWTLSVGLVLVFPLSFWLYSYSGLLMKLSFFLISLESIRITGIAVKRRQRGAKIMASGALSFFVFFSIFTAMSYGYLSAGKFWIYGISVFTLCVLSFPVAISLFLALEFAFTSHSLETKLLEVKGLSEEKNKFQQELQNNEVDKAVRVALATENERRRIAADMHDDLGASLSGLQLMSELSGRKENMLEVRKDINKIHLSAKELNLKVKDIVWTLDPKNDSLENLVLYIHRYGQHLFEDSGILFGALLPDTFPSLIVEGKARRQLLLLIQEAFANIIKHAQATEAFCTITFTDYFSITIRDNGQGMPAQPRPGNGIRNMQYRVEQLKGQVTITGIAGTTVKFDVPVSSLTTPKGLLAETTN